MKLENFLKGISGVPPPQCGKALPFRRSVLILFEAAPHQSEA